ncbi:MAG TPA: UvrD-helicase domain-containing protein, partial [Bacteroidales bacterium]|nr:UvrD-helicase domain-containing protein [Bacteroidales bacterium]
MGNFEIYKSSAGSGKTYTLVLRYLSLALKEHGYFRHILAITFTNKAANEMKQRIINGLIHLADPQKYADSPTVRFMLPDLAKEMALSAEEVTVRAVSELKLLLHDYDNFAISTIDSFVTKLIRSFAHDLYLPVDFTIETDQERLLIKAVDRLLSKAGLDEEITRVLVAFAESKSEDEKDWRIEKDLFTVSEELLKEESFDPVRLLTTIPLSTYRELAVKIRLFVKRFETDLSRVASRALDFLKNAGIQPDWLFQKEKGIAGYFEKFRNKEISLEVKTYVRKTIDENCWYSKSTPVEIQRIVDEAVPQLRIYFDEIRNRLQEHGATYFLLKMVGDALYQIAVVGEIEKELEEVKRDNDLLFISEFNKIITDVIIREPVPFIYERIGEKFRHYLVDEFQDTSELQWKNLLPLFGNSLATGSKNLVVGDGKQAIYRFRNGQVDQ